MKQRRVSRRISPVGFTLVETVVMVTLSAVLTGIVITGMAALYRYDRSTSSQRTSRVALRDLAISLRRDVHAASSVRWDEATHSLALEQSDTSMVEYRKTEIHWERVDIHIGTEPVVTGFGLDDSFHCVCDEQEVIQGSLLRVSFTNENGDRRNGTDKERRTVRCDLVALVGRDRSFTKIE